MRAFLNPKGHQTVLNSLRLGNGLGTREHLFVSVKINYIVAIATSKSKREGSKMSAYIALVYTDLVDETHDVGVGPARLVEVVGLLQHLRQLLASHVPKVKKMLINRKYVLYYFVFFL